MGGVFYEMMVISISCVVTSYALRGMCAEPKAPYGGSLRWARSDDYHVCVAPYEVSLEEHVRKGRMTQAEASLALSEGEPIQRVVRMQPKAHIRGKVVKYVTQQRWPKASTPVEEAFIQAIESVGAHHESGLFISWVDDRNAVCPIARRDVFELASTLYARVRRKESYKGG